MDEMVFETSIIEWRGPSPYFFAAIPEGLVAAIRGAARRASYGWGVVPVEAAIGRGRFTTSLFPKDGGYLLPIKASARAEANVTLGDRVTVRLRVVMAGDGAEPTPR